MLQDGEQDAHELFQFMCSKLLDEINDLNMRPKEAGFLTYSLGRPIVEYFEASEWCIGRCKGHVYCLRNFAKVLFFYLLLCATLLLCVVCMGFNNKKIRKK